MIHSLQNHVECYVIFFMGMYITLYKILALEECQF